jgi:hypothetical protein
MLERRAAHLVVILAPHEQLGNQVVRKIDPLSAMMPSEVRIAETPTHLGKRPYREFGPTA